MISPVWAGETIRYTVGGSADTSEKEVNANAYYVTYWSLYGYNHCKKTRKPPLWQVTVSRY